MHDIVGYSTTTWQTVAIKISSTNYIYSRKITLPYFDKRKQLLKMTFLANEHNAYVMYIAISATS